MSNFETEEQVKSRILNDVRIKSLGLNTNEGSQVNNIFSAYATERSKLSVAFENIFDKGFIEDSNNEFLDKRVNEFGLFRKEGYYSTGKVRITINKQSVDVATGLILTVNNLQYQVLEPKTITMEDNITTVVAKSVGAEYNLYIGTEFDITKDLEGLGITDIVTTEGFDNGVGVETDEELKERFYNTQRSNATSGNIEHYKQWALETDGVYSAKVVPLWAGNGTVKVSISGRGNTPVSSEVLENCRTHIEEVRPIGATVTVATTKLKNITINAQIEKSTLTDIEVIKMELEEAIKDYLSIATKEVTFSKIYSIIASNENVADVGDITLNSAKSNIVVGDDELATLKSLSLEVI